MDSDPTPAQIAGTAAKNEGNSGMYQLCIELKQEQRIIAEYFNWNGTRAGQLASPKPPLAHGIAELIYAHVQTHPADRIAIVGNSWGGHTAWEVTDCLLQSENPIAVNCLVLLDPSSTGRSAAPPKALPINVNRGVNFFTRNVFVWGKQLAGRQVEHIDLGDPASGYLQKDGPAYNAPFSFPAHVSAEWDQRIHDEIKRRLAAVLEHQEALAIPDKR